MKINIATTQEAEMAYRLTLIEIDNEITIAIQGFGTGEARWKITGDMKRGTTHTTAMQVIQEALHFELDKDGYAPVAALGAAFVWMEETTWAYAINNLLDNI